MIRCDEVIVKFIKRDVQGTRIMTSMGPTFAKYLKVCPSEHTLFIHFCDKDDNSVKLIAYNFSEVLEFTCEGFHPAPKEGLTYDGR